MPPDPTGTSDDIDISSNRVMDMLPHEEDALSTSRGEQRRNSNQGGAPSTQDQREEPSMLSSNYWNTERNNDLRNSRVAAEIPLNLGALQMALPPEVGHFSNTSRDLETDHNRGVYDEIPNFVDEINQPDYADSDTAPLTSTAQPISGASPAGLRHPHAHDRLSDQVAAAHNDSQHYRSGSRGRSYGVSLDPHEPRTSRSSSPSGALLRAGSMVRAMSQRVVNLSGESDIYNERRASMRSSRSSHDDFIRRDGDNIESTAADTSYQPQLHPPHVEKPDDQNLQDNRISAPRQPRRAPNPLKGYSLGIFAPNNPIRLRLCNILVHPATEPIILVLIVLQTVLLAVEAGPSVFSPGNGRPTRWSGRALDWIMLALFIIFSIELVARTIVSGFIINAAEYSTIDRRKGVRSVVADQYRSFFQPQRQRSVRLPTEPQMEPQPISRSFTTFMQSQNMLPETIEEQQKYQLARRALLRHSFNRLDFVAVVSFWIDFVLSITGVENTHHLYLFKMLSCLRILRLLAITHGTAIILQSLKKAAPLLVRVAFLICFFWLLFAIIGVQSFKSSLSRQCVWIDPLDPKNMTATFTHEKGFCGGFLDNSTGQTRPWVRFGQEGSLDGLEDGTKDGKGFLCPRGSICLQQHNPYNGTVNFDNILHSLELVFVIMSANTFTDLMYYTMGSDYIQAALFFGAGIMIMMLWMTNLLIAVITSSFQVIRDESKASAFAAEDKADVQPFIESPVRRASVLQRIIEKGKIVPLAIISFGLLCQAFRSARMPPGREQFINGAEIAVTILLDVEIVLRYIANWRHFHRSQSNLFDLMVAIITSIILIPVIRSSRAYDWLTAFQIVRVYRVVLAIPITGKLILLVLGNASGIANLMLFVFLMTFLVAIFASQLFRGIIPLHEGEDLNRISFFTIYNSFLGMYQILSSENWTDILYSVTSYTHEFKTSWIGAGFLIGWFILSYFILVNMFIAVIQENFDVSEDEKRLEQVKAFLQRKELGYTTGNLALSTIFSFGRSKKRKDPLDYGPAMMEMLLKDAVVREFLDEQMGENGQHAASADATMPSPPDIPEANGSLLIRLWKRAIRRFSHKEQNPFYTSIRFDRRNDTLDPREMARQVVSATTTRRREQREYLTRHPSYNTSLYIFKPNNWIRRLCQRLVGPARGYERFDGVEPNKIAWYAFSAFVYAAVVAMVILACITTPLYQKKYKEEHAYSVTNWYVWTDLAFTVLFTIEACIKVVADGLLWTPNAYLRSAWGIVDTVVLITLWINSATLLVNDGAISRAVGAFKALRALRLLNVSDSARNTFYSLIIVGWWKLFGAAFVSISLLIPFAIYGLNLFNGQMISCNDGGDITTLTECFGEYNSTPFSDKWPMLSPRVATNSYFKFDDFGSSLFILFQIVSQEGWTDVSFAAQAITGRGMQPQDLASQGNAIFFVIFNLLATVFVLTLFISVFMRNYTEQTGVAFLTTEQRAWLELRKLLRQISPSKTSYNESENTWKKWCHKRAIEKRGKWYQTVTVVLVLHLTLLVLEFSGEPTWWTWTRDSLFLAFILIYIANVLIRIFGLSWTRFRKSSWDVYSLVVVTGAFISTLALLSSDTKRETYVQLHKFFLVAVVLLLIPRNDALDQLFKTAAASLPIISNLLATWLVLFLVFAIALTQAFSLTRFGKGGTSNLNFRTVPKALILLFRMSLGEGWNQIMEDFAGVEPPLCVESSNFFNSDCGSKPWARALFVAWNILSMYIFVNLFVSLIYESFSYVYQRSTGVAAVDRDEIRRFKEAWRSVDPAGTGFISKEAFPRLLGELSGVFQMRIYDPEDSVGQILDDVRNDVRISRHSSIVAVPTHDIDVGKLNKRLAQLDLEKNRRRRRRFNVFYEEVLVSADPDLGIAFTDVLLILAHYNIINDTKSLKLDEFLRRRARLQRVDEEIRRRTVQGFFDTLYWSRRFKQHLEQKRAARLSVIPQLNLPEILVNDEDGPIETSNERWGSEQSNLGAGPTLQRKKSAWSTDKITRTDDGGHPLSMPRIITSGLASPGTPSALSFDIAREDGQEQSGTMPRRGSSAMSPSQAIDMLDDSVWVQSIRKSKTLRKSDRTSYRYGDIG